MKLLDWYRKNCRALPWRLHHADPYQIWISEVMSQQSTLKSVIPYFERWMNRFPTVQKVAAARESSLLSLWQGLGYYSRAKNIHRSAKQLKEYIDKNQQWPEKTEEWLNFPGVGRYTAKAVTSICFGASDVPVDGNVLRVLGRFWAYKDAYNDAQFQRVCEEALMSLSEKTIDIVDRGQFSQSLMELGATVCRPQGEIHCERCPLKSNCLSHSKKLVHEIPAKKKKASSIKIDLLQLLYRNKNGALVLRKIPEGKRLAGQWELPHLALESSEKFVQKSLAQHFEIWPSFSHSITRYRYKVHPLEAGTWRGRLPQDHCFYDSKKMGDEEAGKTSENSGEDPFVLTTATQKCFENLRKMES